jgi:hypothetical protein
VTVFAAEAFQGEVSAMRKSGLALGILRLKGKERRQAQERRCQQHTWAERIKLIEHLGANHQATTKNMSPRSYSCAVAAVMFADHDSLKKPRL